MNVGAYICQFLLRQQTNSRSQWFITHYFRVMGLWVGVALLGSAGLGWAGLQLALWVRICCPGFHFVTQARGPATLWDMLPGWPRTEAQK